MKSATNKTKEINEYSATNLYDTLKVLINMCGGNHVVSNFGTVNILVAETKRMKPDLYLDIC